MTKSPSLGPLHEQNNFRYASNRWPRRCLDRLSYEGNDIILFDLKHEMRNTCEIFSRSSRISFIYMYHNLA